MSKMFGGRTLLIGLGGIGMGYDLGDTESREMPTVNRRTSRTHANAIQGCESLELVGGVDPDGYKRDAFERGYGCRAWPSLADVPLDLVDTVVLASPTSTHLPVTLEALSRLSPSWVICEKPLGESAADARMISSQCEKHGAALTVNYFRLYQAWAQNLHQDIRAGMLGRLLGGSVLYSHGLRRNGCHFLNLVIWLVGFDAKLSAAGNGMAHGEPSFQLRVDDSCVGFQSVRPSAVRAADVTLVFEGGIFRMENGGHRVTWETATERASKKSPKYATTGWTEADEMLDYQSLVYHHLLENGRDARGRRWNVDSAILTQEIMDEVTNG